MRLLTHSSSLSPLPLAAARRDVEAPQGEATTKTVEEVAEMLVHAKKIVLVPGYGVAVAKAQYAIASMIEYLRKKVRPSSSPFLSSGGDYAATGIGVTFAPPPPHLRLDIQ